MSAKTDLKLAIDKAVVDVARDPTSMLTPIDAAAVAAAVNKEAAPVVLNDTNNEPWYQSRVTIGALVSAGIPILGALGVATDWIKPDEVVGIIIAIGTAAGSVLTLYGRWKARKPLGY